MSLSFIYVPPIKEPADSKVVWVGESPGETEEKGMNDTNEAKEYGIPPNTPMPLIGESGKKWMNCLGRRGTNRHEHRIFNLCNYRPPENKFTNCLETPELKAGIAELVESCRVNPPNVIAGLGAWPLYFLTGKYDKAPGFGIGNWRGSILPCTLKGLEGIKVICTFHPAAVLREATNYPLFDFDVKRIVSDSKFKEFKFRERKFIIAPKGNDLDDAVKTLLSSSYYTVDIETIGTEITCIGFAPSPDLAYCLVPDGTLEYTQAVATLLSSPVPKITHFGYYDKIVLEHFNGFKFNNLAWDTYVSAHVLEPELPSSLASQTSLCTREPYYKDERKEGGGDRKSWSRKMPRNRLYTYNCKDVTCTAEVYEDHLEQIKGLPRSYLTTLTHEMELLRDTMTDELGVSRAGMLVDNERLTLIKAVLAHKYVKYQNGLDSLVGVGVNVGSPEIIKLLYEILELPPRKKRDGKLTADEDAIVSLIALCKEKLDSLKTDEAKLGWKRKLAILKGILIIRGIKKMYSSYANMTLGLDGRVRSIYKVGPETGRWAASKFVDKTGLNPMTFPRDPIEISEEELEEIKKNMNTLLAIDLKGKLNEDDEDDEEDENE